MKLNKIITFVVLALSFCVFDQMKDHLVEEMDTSNANYGVLMGSVDKIHDIIPGSYVKTEVIPCKEDSGDKGKGLISVELGKKICNTILRLKF